MVEGTDMSSEPEEGNGFRFFNFFEIGMIGGYKHAFHLDRGHQPMASPRGTAYCAFSREASEKIVVSMVSIRKNSGIVFPQALCLGGAFQESYLQLKKNHLRHFYSPCGYYSVPNGIETIPGFPFAENP